MSLKGKTIVITGASRGIGRAIALKSGEYGANVVIAAKSNEPHPKLPGTIHSVKEEVEARGGRALAVQVDVREELDVEKMVNATVSTFGGIDALINNAGALSMSSIENTPMKRFDLVHAVNVRAAYLCVQKALPHLKKSVNPHIINLSPPMTLDPKWYAENLAYTLSKIGVTLCTVGMAKAFAEYGISVNSIWPRRVIESSATEMLLGKEGLKKTRRAEIMGDAVLKLLLLPRGTMTGQTLTDEQILGQHGMKSFESYNKDPKELPLLDYFLKEST